ncbi:hypothetical protein HWV62_21828 [Athelia sp. TMB]|nr:hypothetical protein HWV62_21828 [Athelia sp. TMB]
MIAAPLEVQPAQQQAGGSSVNPDAMETKMAAEKAHYAASSPTQDKGGNGDGEMAPAEQHDYGFAHPAASRPQRTVWLARDALGLAAEEEKANRERGIDVSTRDAQMDLKGHEEKANRERGIDVSTRDAQMDLKGHVEIEGPPPGEEE